MTQQPSDYKEVRFDEWCDKCAFKDQPEESDECNECLTNTVNLYSHKPTGFKEVDK